MVFRGDFEEELFEAGAVGDRGVEIPDGGLQMIAREGLADERDGLGRFGDFLEVTVHAGHVTITAIAALEEDAAGESGFDGGEDIVAVEFEDGAGELWGVGDLASLAVSELFIGTGAAADGDALALGEGVTVADESAGGFFRVAAGEEPAEISAGGAQAREHFGSEGFGVAWILAAVLALVGHWGKWRMADDE